MGFEVYTSTGWKTGSGIEVYTASGWKAVTNGWVYTSTGWKKFFSAAPSCSIPASPFTEGFCAMSCDVNVADGCESVVWEWAVNGGGWNSGGTIDTADPPSNPYVATVNSSIYPSIANGDDFEFRFTPWSGDSGTGTSGTTCISAPSPELSSCF